MSLINQMLKDLDKRGSGASAGNAYPGPVRSVPDKKGGSRLAVPIVLLLIAIGAAAAWYFWLQPKTPAVSPQAKAASAPAAAPVPAQKPAEAVAAVASLPPAPTVAAGKPIADPTPVAQDMQAAKPKASTPAVATEAAARPAADRPSSAAATAAKPARQKGAEPVIAAKETTPQQKAESEYNQAILLMNSRRKAEAIVTLEQALALDPRHAAARQTLAGLLLDSKRGAEAARVLDEGLTLDPKQTGMAMILARIQIENSGVATALATLDRSRPYAANNPDYLAFMAALMQREKRHPEAIDLYAQALGRAPQNAHWWMGYGISLAAAKRPADARQAFVRARDLRKLSPELQAYVEQEISKL